LQQWPLTIANTDSAAVRASVLTATSPTLNRLYASNNSTITFIPPTSPTYGFAYGASSNGDGSWGTSVGGPGGNLSRATYVQFTVQTQSGSGAVRIDSIVLASAFYNTSSNTKMAVVYSLSGFASDSSDVTGGIGPAGALAGTANGAFATPILLANQTGGPTNIYRLALNGSTGVTLNASQTLTIRIYNACGSTSAGRYACIKNVQIMGSTGSGGGSGGGTSYSLTNIAFPGAEGYGKYTTGGKGSAGTPTTVFKVTSLADDGSAGTLRWALTQTAAYRTIVFDVSGTIHLQSKLQITKPYTTIAGQTAPGDGICLADYPVQVNADNVIVRYMRFRMGDKNQNLGMVNGSGADDAFDDATNSHKNIIIDHCTMGWSNDEACTFYGGDSLTLQWNVMSEPLNYSYHFETGDADYEQHGYGGIWGGQHASFHHNLFAHCKSRTPRFNGNRTGYSENADFRNNVIYNWSTYQTYGGEGGNYNIVNNYYKFGPNTPADKKVFPQSI